MNKKMPGGLRIKRIEFRQLSTFEKLGFVAIFLFFAFMIFLFFIIPKL